jgi:hypothetical protein
MDTNVTAAATFVRDSGAGSTVDVLGVKHIYKATAAETGLFLAVGSGRPAGRRRSAAHPHPRG